MSSSLLRALVVVLTLLGFASARPAAAAPVPKLARATGKAFGFGAGVVVTAGLVMWKKWNKPMLDDHGNPQQIVVRGKTFTLRERHRPVLGPDFVKKANAMKTGTRLQRLKHALVLGFGEGATKAPPAEGRFEAGLFGKR